MFTMWLDLSLCGMWYCEALVVLLVGVLLCRVLTLPWVYCVICTMHAAACSISVVVYSALLYVATACLLRPCWEKVLGSPKLGWVIVILSVGQGIGRGWVVGWYFGRETTFITNIFKKADIRITLRTNNTLQKLLMTKPQTRDKYSRSGAYKLTCPDCNKAYVGQTG